MGLGNMKFLTHTRRWPIGVAMIAVTAFSLAAWAQFPIALADPTAARLPEAEVSATASGSTYRLRASTFGASGVKAMSGNFKLRGTLAQESVIGAAKGRNLRVNAGFWRAPTQILFGSTPPPSTTPGVCGDQNGDGAVDFFDIMIDLQIAFLGRIPTAEQLRLSDLDRDGKITLFDAIALMQHTYGNAGPIPGCGPP